MRPCKCFTISDYLLFPVLVFSRWMGKTAPSRKPHFVETFNVKNLFFKSSECLFLSQTYP